LLLLRCLFDRLLAWRCLFGHRMSFLVTDQEM